MHVHFLGEPNDGLSISSHHARVLAGLGAEVSFASSDAGGTAAARAADVIHVVTRGLIHPSLLRDVLRLRGTGKPVARIWTGEDVLWASWHAASRAAAIGLARTGVAQFCRSLVEAERLATLGIEARTLPVLSVNVCVRSKPEPLPKQFTLLCLLPAAKREFYGGALIDSLVRWLPSVRFLILGDAARTCEAKNVEALCGVDDIGRTIQRATAVLHARRDRTMSRIVPEALSHGRHVISACGFPNTITAKSIDEHLEAIRSLQREPTFNLAGREEVGRSYDRKITGEALRNTLAAMIEERDWTSAVRGSWLCATGLGRAPLGELSIPPDQATLPPEAEDFKALLRSQCAAEPVGASDA